jgi:hypothetical protein
MNVKKTALSHIIKMSKDNNKKEEKDFSISSIVLDQFIESVGQSDS